MSIGFRLLALCIFLLGLASQPVFAQAERESVQHSKPKYNSFSMGLNIHNYGIGLDFHITRRLSDRLSHFSTVFLSSVKDPREFRIDSKYADAGGKPYIYDKRNYCYIIGATYGLQTTLFQKTPYSRFSIWTSLSGGPLLALLKPYYVEVLTNNPLAPTLPVPYDESLSDPNNVSIIYGEGDYFKGFNEIKANFGLRLKANLTFNFSGSTLYVRGLSVGCNVDFYPKKLNLMVVSGNRNVFVGAYLGFLIGNAW